MLVDANPTHVVKARTFFGDHLGVGASRVNIRSLFVTPHNINELFAEVTPNGEELDLLSIDVGSIDDWIGEALSERFRPGVIITEYNASFGPHRSVTVARGDGRGFDPFTRHPSGFYHGASLESLRKLAASRGHQLIGCDSAGVGAFFVRRDCALGLPDLDSRSAYMPNAWRRDADDPEKQYALIAHLPLTEI